MFILLTFYFSQKQGRKRLVDLKKIRVCGGKGGDGAVSFKKYAHEDRFIMSS